MSAMRWFTPDLPAASGSWGGGFFAWRAPRVVAACVVVTVASATQPLPPAPGEASQVRATPIIRDALTPASRFVTVNLIETAPPIEEPASLLARQRTFALKRATATIEIYPVRIGQRVDSSVAAQIARQLCASGIGALCGVAAPVLLAAPEAGGSARAAPWILARDFSARLRSRPSDADYALYAAYDIDPATWERTTVQLVLCTACGDLVIVDGLSAAQPNFRRTKPVHVEDCTDLLLLRLRAYVTRTPGDASSQPPDARRASAMAKNLSP